MFDPFSLALIFSALFARHLVKKDEELYKIRNEMKKDVEEAVAENIFDVSELQRRFGQNFEVGASVDLDDLFPKPSFGAAWNKREKKEYLIGLGEATSRVMGDFGINRVNSGSRAELDDILFKTRLRLSKDDDD